MATSIRQILIDLEVSGAVAATAQDTTTYDSALQQDFVAALSATEDVNGSTLDVKIQDSPDGGTTWFDWITFTQLSATGSEAKAPTRNPLGLLKVVRTISAGGGTYSYKVFLSANPLR